jgi:hypothetical protein
MKKYSYRTEKKKEKKKQTAAILNLDRNVSYVVNYSYFQK